MCLAMMVRDCQAMTHDRGELKNAIRKQVSMAIAPIAEEAKVLRIKGLGIGTEEVGPKFPYSFYASANIYAIPVCYDFLTKNYPKAKKIAIITPDDPGARA